MYSRVRHDGIHVPASRMHACTYVNRVLSSLMRKTRQIRLCEGDSRVPKTNTQFSCIEYVYTVSRIFCVFMCETLRNAWACFMGVCMFIYTSSPLLSHV